MPYRLLASGAFVCALTLLGFAGQADATTRLMLNGTSSLTILAEMRKTPKCRICSSLKLTVASLAAMPR